MPVPGSQLAGKLGELGIRDAIGAVDEHLVAHQLENHHEIGDVAERVAAASHVGPKRTRLAAQIAAAVIGGLFVIGLQMAAMFSTGTMSRLAFLQSKYVVAHMPDIHSAIWWPARGALGDLGCLAAFLAASTALFLLVTAIYAPRFADCAIAAAGTSQGSIRKSGTERPFRVTSPAATLRRKEILLLLRDPWLASQSLMQLLYLLPPTVLLWRSFTFEGGVAVILVPVLIMSAGQLGGGLAWLTVSGEDAPDIVETAPISKSSLLRAKIAAVLECIAIIFAPFVVALAFVSPEKAVVAAVGIFASAMSSSLIQLWFRSQAKRSQFRRRHTSSVTQATVRPASARAAMRASASA